MERMDALPPPDYALPDRLGVSDWIFYPRPDVRPPPPGAADHAIEVAPGISVASRFYPADPTFPSILFFHGNGEVAGDYDEIAPLYHRARLNLWVADYRGYGASGGKPSFAALIADAHPVLERFHAVLDQQGFAPSRFVMGRSLGGYPATELAARAPERLRGLVLESSAANLGRLVQRALLGAPAGEAERLVEAHHAKIAAIRLPTLMIHGDEDELIPVEHAVEFFDALEAEPKELAVIPGAGHNDLLWVGARRYFEALAAFVARHAATA
jgi:pimeloyl-ACP methyl ester carboxylesterase